MWRAIRRSMLLRMRDERNELILAAGCAPLVGGANVGEA